MSQVGHGELGLRSGLRPFRELAEQSYCARRAYLDLEVGKVVVGAWSFVTSGTWQTTQLVEHDGTALEPVGVDERDGARLTRAETVVACQATAGTFYAVPATGLIYIHLEGDADPNDTRILVCYLRRFGSSGTVDPVFGPERLADGGFEEWVSGGTALVEWAFGGTLTLYSLAQELGNVFAGGSAARISGGNAGSSGLIAQDVALVKGADYVFSGAYRTMPGLEQQAEAGGAGLQAAVRVRLTGSTYLYWDYRLEASDAVLALGFPLGLTGGEWRRFLLHFRSPNDFAAAQLAVMLSNFSGTTNFTGWACFDDLSFRRVYRWEYAEPRLSLEGLPAVEMGCSDVFFGVAEVGLGTVKVLNSDDEYLEALLGDFDVIGRRARMWRGGAFDDGQEITGADWSPGFAGLVQATAVDDEAATLDVSDGRSLLALGLPTRCADVAMFPDLSSRDAGRPRALLFGMRTGILPIRIGRDATTKLPIYEVADPTERLATGSGCYPFAAWAYLDEEAANTRDAARRVELLLGSQYSLDADTRQVTILQNPGPFVVTGTPAQVEGEIQDVGANDTIDFIADSVTYAAAIPPGIYTSAGVAAAAELAMKAAAGGAFVTVSYSDTTHLFTFTWTSAGNFQLLLDTGAHKHRSAFPMMGMTGSADKTGAVSYDSEVPLYAEALADGFVIRFDARGHLDDAAGTYTGTAGALIVRPADVLHFLLRRVLKRPADEVDLASFEAGRVASPQVLGVLLGGTASVTGGEAFGMTLQEVIDRLEAGSHADVVLDSRGAWHWSPRGVSSALIAEEAAKAPLLVDSDFLSFTSSKSSACIYETVRVLYDQDPATAFVRSFEVFAKYAATGMRHGRREARAFPTFLTDVVDAQTQAWNLLLLGTLPRRTLRFTVKGILIEALPGDLVRVQRSRMMGEEIAGQMNADVFRILRLSVDALTHQVECECYGADMPRVAEQIIRSIPVGRAWRPVQWGVSRGPDTFQAVRYAEARR